MQEDEEFDAEVDAYIFEQDMLAEGIEVADQMRKARRDDAMAKIVAYGYKGALADQIYERFQERDWDYQTPQGNVISNVVFFEKGIHEEEPEIDNRGRKDLPMIMLEKVTEETRVRPKLPGKMMTQAQVRIKGMKTCYDIVELVGKTPYGLYPEERICNCCEHNTFVKLKEVCLQPWHEGLMVKLTGIEYRVRRYQTQDREFQGSVWETENRNEVWVKVKPRGINKRVQKEKVQVTLPMLYRTKEQPQGGKRWMSKAIVWGREGHVLVQQNGVWDMVGGKQELKDLTPEATLMREYKEELKHECPNYTMLGSYESESFEIYLYLVKDGQMRGGIEPTLLQGIQRECWLKANEYLGDARSYILNSTDLAYYKEAEKKRKKRLEWRSLQKIVESELLYETDSLLSMPLMYMQESIRGYLLPMGREQAQRFREELEKGKTEWQAFEAVLGESHADKVCGRKRVSKRVVAPKASKASQMDLLRDWWRTKYKQNHVMYQALDFVDYSLERKEFEGRRVLQGLVVPRTNSEMNDYRQLEEEVRRILAARDYEGMLERSIGWM